jgi:hypothetical protein
VASCAFSPRTFVPGPDKNGFGAGSLHLTDTRQAAADRGRAFFLISLATVYGCGGVCRQAALWKAGGGAQPVLYSPVYVSLDLVARGKKKPVCTGVCCCLCYSCVFLNSLFPHLPSSALVLLRCMRQGHQLHSVQLPAGKLISRRLLSFHASW